MPLHEGSSDKVIAKNIKKLLKEGGRSREQVIAIALSHAGKSKEDKPKDN